jgi:hypothetical protein
MGKLTEQLILDFSLVQDTKLTFEDLSTHFADIPTIELYLSVNNLAAKRLLDEDPLQYSWALSANAKILMETHLPPTQPDQRLSQKKPTDHLYTGWVAWLAICLALVIVLAALAGFLMKVE